MPSAANKLKESHGRWRPWVWFCPWVMLGVAVAMLFIFGLSVWIAALAAMLLACPASIFWGAVHTRKHRQTGG